jgi:murein L,D-transpeptidase YcbB/YkuD
MSSSIVFLRKISLLLILSTVLSIGLCGSFAFASSSLFGAFLGQPGPQIEDFLAAGNVENVKLMDKLAQQDFYEAREYKPVWLTENGKNLSSDGEKLLERLQQSWAHGLNPQTYQVDVILSLIEQAGGAPMHGVDVLLTEGFIRYAQDLSGMRVEAEKLGLDPADWLAPITVRSALGILAAATALEDVWQRIEPQSSTSALLRDELVKLAEAPPEPYADVMPLGFGDVMLRPMDRHVRMPDLRLRLGVEPQTDDKLLYDDRLVAAVIKFQRQHGLKQDGYIGANTLRALNRTQKDRMRQIIANLERLRWVDARRPHKYVVVNIPAATLWAIENDQVAFEMSVIVGRAKRATNSFITQITGVRFNPDWTVPPTIKKDDLWPKLIENPEYLFDKGIELYLGYDRDSETLDPASIDWASLTPNDLHALRMVQTPGPHNPLGRIRVLMPNKYNIYLHDTNERSLFTRAERAQSSGCIRMEHPEAMAAFIMSGQKKWNPERVAESLQSEKTKDYLIDQPIPIYLLYYTVWADSEGAIVYGTDIYGEDEKLLKTLENIDGFVIPRYN